MYYHQITELAGLQWRVEYISFFTIAVFLVITSNVCFDVLPPSVGRVVGLFVATIGARLTLALSMQSTLTIYF